MLSKGSPEERHYAAHNQVYQIENQVTYDAALDASLRWHEVLTGKSTAWV